MHGFSRDKNAMRARFGLPKDRVIGAFLGRLDVPKNFFYALKAYFEMANDNNLGGKTLFIKGFFVRGKSKKDKVKGEFENLKELLPGNYIEGYSGYLEDNTIKIAEEFVKLYGGKIIYSNKKQYVNEGKYGADTLIVEILDGSFSQEIMWSTISACDFMLMPSLSKTCS